MAGALGQAPSHQAGGVCARVQMARDSRLPQAASALPSTGPDATWSSLHPGLWDLCLVHPALTGACPPGLTHFYVPLSHQGPCHAVFLWPGNPVGGRSQPWGPLQQEENLPFVEQGGWLPREAWRGPSSRGSRWASCCRPFSVHCSAPPAPQHCSCCPITQFPLPALPTFVTSKQTPLDPGSGSLVGGGSAGCWRPFWCSCFWSLLPPLAPGLPLPQKAGLHRVLLAKPQLPFPRGALQAGCRGQGGY